jgi:MATE family multidrug resistance protein
MSASAKLRSPEVALSAAPAPRLPLDEAGKIVRLAAPVMVAQVGLLAMGLVDTWAVGRLNRPADLAAVALGDSCFFTIAVVAIGLIQALDPLIAQAHGAGDAGRCAAAWRAGVRLALVLTVPVALVVMATVPLLRSVAGLDPEVVATAGAYLAARLPGILPWLLYSSDRYLLNGLGATMPTMVVTLVANVLNGVLDWALIFGAWGAPALGVVGSGLATAACSWFMYLALAVYMRRHPRYADYRRGGPVEPGLVRLVVRLGLPLGLTHALEVGAFSVASVLVGRLGVVALAGHQVAIKMASTSFMVAVAVGVATSIRVGQLTGRGEPAGAARAGWVGLGLGVLWMAAAGVLFLAFRREIVGAFTSDPQVVSAGASLLVIAAAFQVFDGTQAVAGGALRGLGDTRFPMLANLGAYWVVALPLGAVLGFRAGLGAEGVWWALALGLLLAASVLVLRFHAMRGAKPITQP